MGYKVLRFKTVKQNNFSKTDRMKIFKTFEMNNFLKKTSKWVIRSIVGGYNHGYETLFLHFRIQFCIMQSLFKSIWGNYMSLSKHHNIWAIIFGW